MNIPLKDKHPAILLIVFIGLAIVTFIVVTLLGMVGGVIMWGNDFLDIMMEGSQNGIYGDYAKYMQLLSHLGMLIFPAIIFGRLTGGKILNYFTLRKFGKGSAVFMAIIMAVVAQPLIALLTEWNAGMVLPESMSETEQWMRASEDQAMALTEMFLNVSTGGALLFNIFLLAIIPAIGEEVVFRGIVQKQVQRWTNSGWIAIVISGFLFSAIHMQFYGFVPRFIIGILLGYVFWKSGRLWLSILIHFLNNAMAVVAYYMHFNGMIDLHPDEMFSFSENIPLLLISFLLLGGSVVVFHNIYKKRKHE
ncbi:MAG: hypothetical protein C0592_13930 [Marinilabiliales bacterium]|nr:MAG: hypothetical protein C0592_13930 [Marinilabiliales bacterium]